MTSTRGSRSPRRASATTLRFALALLLLGMLVVTHLFASVGCSSGAICYRNTDCPYASDCVQGQCVRRVAGDAGVAGTSSVDDGSAGEPDQSQTPDAN